MKTKVINIFGSPCSGKSTIASSIFSLLKLHGVNTELVTEYAKDIAWEERKSMFENQYYIWGKQYNKMWRLKGKVDIIVTDSPLPISLVHSLDFPECFHKTIIKSFNEFENINYLIVGNNVPYRKEGRKETEEEAIKLRELIRLKLHKYKIVYEEIQNNISSINIIVNKHLKELGICQKYCLFISPGI